MCISATCYRAPAFIEHMARSKNVDIELTFTNMPDFVFTDDTKLSQIVNNHALNAINAHATRPSLPLIAACGQINSISASRTKAGELACNKLREIYHSFEADRDSFTGLGLRISRNILQRNCWAAAS